MSCRFPSSVETLPQYWSSLNSGEDQVKSDPLRGDFEAGFLDSVVSRFDHRYFNIPEAEARSMDPQQILALELTEMLFRDSTIDLAALDKNRVGVYIGVWNEEYLGNRDSVYYPTGTNPSIIASRISYHYDLRGQLDCRYRLLLFSARRALCLQGYRGGQGGLCHRRRREYDPGG